MAQGTNFITPFRPESWSGLVGEGEGVVWITITESSGDGAGLFVGAAEVEALGEGEGLAEGDALAD